MRLTIGAALCLFAMPVRAEGLRLPPDCYPTRWRATDAGRAALKDAETP